MGEWKSKLAGIYMLTFPNGKVYVGKSVHLKKRLLEHKLSKGGNTMLKDAANDMNMPYQSIQRVLSGRRKSSRGLVWKYYNE